MDNHAVAVVVGDTYRSIACTAWGLLVVGPAVANQMALRVELAVLV